MNRVCDLGMKLKLEQLNQDRIVLIVFVVLVPLDKIVWNGETARQNGKETIP